MPLAIVGIRYDTAWREYEERRRRECPELDAKSILDGPLTTRPSAFAAAVKGNIDRTVDDTLQPLEARKVYTLSSVICDRFYEIASKICEINLLAEKMFKESDDSVTQDSQLTLVKSRNETTVIILEVIMGVLKTHKSVCTDIRGLVPLEQAKKTHVNRSSSGRRSSGRDGSLTKTASFATSVFGKARRALSTMGARSHRYMHTGPVTWRSRVWDIIEYNDRTRRAVVINKIRLLVVVLSIALFYAQTTPELQKTGHNSALCKRSIQDFCKHKVRGFFDQPGCFVLDAQGKATAVHLRFDCAASDSSAQCYGNAYNYGSEHFALTCRDVFGAKGMQRVCNNRLCQSTLAFWFNMEPFWVYLEFFFNLLFIFEMAVHVYVHPCRKNVIKDLRFFVDVLILVPFFVELGQIISGTMPIYSVVPTAPSFFSVIRVLKTFRILKLGTHIPGAEVLSRTAYLVHKRLMIPVCPFVSCDAII
ncbi:hypothetical protein PINS_up009608 [Pythium insidiosum]|nr:hypothetical protein PINS_up009608 [Pythium insidiosum]